jgi:hypothetical protein
VALDVVREREAGDPGDDVASEGRSVIGLGRHLARRKDPRREVGGEERAEGQQVSRGSGVRPEVMLLEARGMREQMGEGDGLRVGRRDLKVQIVIDIRVQDELALRDELHDSGPGDNLGDSPLSGAGVPSIGDAVGVDAGLWCTSHNAAQGGGDN